MMSLSRKILLISLLIAGFIYFWTLFETQSTVSFYGHKLFLSDLGSNNFSENYVITHKGPVSMEELEEKVYRPLNYSIAWPTYPVPTLVNLNAPKCNEVFENWLEIAKKPQLETPPKQIPKNMTDDFLLNGYAAVNSWYTDGRTSLKESEKPLLWNYISNWMKYSERRLRQLGYSDSSFSMFHAMKSHNVTGQSGAIIGSQSPWLEVFALRNGAAQLLTIEYSKLDIEKSFRNRISAISPLKFSENWMLYTGNGYDFVASYSSIEHSGLGRYGDPFDPIGDIREIQKIRCILKPGGLLFLGLPLGTDAISFNVHRIYGPIRLALMMVGFDWIATYNGGGKFDMNTWEFHRDELFAFVRQHTLVLRKT